MSAKAGCSSRLSNREVVPGKGSEAACMREEVPRRVLSSRAVPDPSADIAACRQHCNGAAVEQEAGTEGSAARVPKDSRLGTAPLLLLPMAQAAASPSTENNPRGECRRSKSAVCCRDTNADAWDVAITHHPCCLHCLAAESVVGCGRSASHILRTSRQ